MNTFSDFLVCCTSNAILYFKTCTDTAGLTLRTKQWQIWTGCSVASMHTAWSGFVSGAFSRAEVPVCLLESGHLSASKLSCAQGISRHWSDNFILVNCWNGSWRGLSLCQLLQTIARHGSGVRILLSWRPGQFNLLV